MSEARQRRGGAIRPGLATLLLLALTAACPGEDRAATSGQGDALPRAPTPSAADPLLARVDGRPILASDLQREARTGESPRQTLERLVEQQILAEEARRRGLQRDPEVRRGEARAMVSVMLRRRFAEGYGKDDIPEDLLRAAYRANRRRFVHPDLVEVSHVVALAGDDESAEKRARAEKMARQLHRLATAEPLASREAFERLAERVKRPEGKPRVDLRVERVITPLRGQTVDAFADAAFALRRPGQISDVVETKFGYHVIYLVDRRPARNTSYEQARPQIRERILEESRGIVFQRWADELRRKMNVEVHPERLHAHTAEPGRPAAP